MNPHLFLPVYFARASVRPVFLDSFTGSGALTAHAPDIYPTGAAWIILNGTFGSLSGGFLPYSSGSFGRAVIGSSLADFELTWRSKHFNVPSIASGVNFRSTSSTIGYSAGTHYNSSAHTIQWNVPSSIKIDPSQPGSGNSRPVSLTLNSYYTWTLIAKGIHARLYNAAGAIMLASAGLANPANTFIGPYCEQPQGSWDFIQVKPLTKRFITFSVCGDSISNDTSEWPYMTGARHNNGYCFPYDYAVSGSTVAAQLSTQVTSCISANADFTIIALGTNDGSNFTATYQTQLERLWSALHKPIYAMGILPKSPEGIRTTANGWILTAVNNARVNGVNVTYWNTDGWIDPATDTGDGLHPGYSGQDKISTQVLARI